MSELEPVIVKQVTRGFLAKEPVMVAAAVTWILTNVGLLIVGHTHIVTQAQWNGLASALAPILSSLFFAAIGLVIRKVVTPAWKAIEANGGISAVVSHFD